MCYLRWWAAIYWEGVYLSALLVDDNKSRKSELRDFFSHFFKEMIENYVHWNEDIGEWQLVCNLNSY